MSEKMLWTNLGQRNQIRGFDKLEPEELQKHINSVCPALTPMEQPSSLTAMIVDNANLHDSLLKLRDDKSLEFNYLVDHTCIDWPEENQFELVYILKSINHGHYISINCRIDRQNPVVKTASDIWPIAEWQEREVYDLFGVLYDGHKDLRRVFLEDDWEGFPLRKDYKDDFMLEHPDL